MTPKEYPAIPNYKEKAKKKFEPDKSFFLRPLNAWDRPSQVDSQGNRNQGYYSADTEPQNFAHTHAVDIAMVGSTKEISDFVEC